METTIHNMMALLNTLGKEHDVLAGIMKNYEDNLKNLWDIVIELKTEVLRLTNKQNPEVYNER